MSKHTHVYIVEGSTGEFVDYTAWFVAAYMDKEKAEQHARLAQEWFDARWSKRADDPSFYGPSTWTKKNPYSPGFAADYTGSSWDVVTVELRNDIPAIEKTTGGEG